MNLLIQPSALQTRIELEKDSLVRVIGPAKLSVLEGDIRILGLDVSKGESIVVSKYRSYCLRAVADSILSILIGEGGSIEKPKPGEEVIDVWESTAKTVAEKGGIAVIVGAVESGKTSFSTLLSNIALDLGLKPCIVDADIGQGDLAPPTFIGMKCMDRKVLWLRGERCSSMRFVGYLSPSNPLAMARVITSVMDLVSEARDLNRDLVIVNTDGWLGDVASIEYKYTLIKTLKPDTVIVLGQEFCSAFQSAFKNTSIEVYCIPRPKVVKERDREDRRDLRRYNYQSWFNNAKRICLDMNSIAVIGLCLLNGVPSNSDELLELKKILGTEVLHIARYTDVDIVAVPDGILVPREILERISSGHRVFIVKPSSAKGLIAAVTDKNLRERGVAVVDDINFIEKKICVLTDYMGEIGGIIVGKVKIGEQWDDNIRFSKCIA
ncbi:MAG: Clp1/GlmU family protein [Ignisphaera sp.]|uniref:polynucleotide 5'-hydroxyl-kinase n=1 Tax=Ignisphaera aggregans TaxID=334771 RepID=A0A7J3MZU3_9CREN